MRILPILAIALTAAAIACASGIAVPDQDCLSCKEVTAKDIVAKVNGSPVILDRVVITDDLELNKTQYDPIKITNSVIRGNISCKGITFYGDVDFSNTSFIGSSIFNGTRFMAEANFNGSRFYGPASFNMSSFAQGGTFDFAYFGEVADFANTWFDKFGTFYNATFLGDALFYLSEFNGAYANFEYTQYLKNADFSGSHFDTYGSFEEAQFTKEADFHASKFTSGSNFHNTRFLGYANFAKSHFIEDSIFSGIDFNDTALFLNAKFDGPTFFNNTIFGGNAIFDNVQFLAPADLTRDQFNKDLKMNSTKINTMTLDGSVFKEGSRLFLAKADINRLMVEWNLIKDILSFDTSAYPSLVKNYRDLGQGNDANDCYYEYRQLNQIHKDLGFSKLLDAVAWISCGYGVRPHYALLCGAFVILLFSLVLLVGRGVEGFNNLHGVQLIAASVYYSTIAFTANAKGLPLKGNYKYLGIAEGIIGWLLMALFLVTLGRLMIG